MGPVLPTSEVSVAVPASVGRRPAVGLVGTSPVKANPTSLTKAGAAVGDASKCTCARAVATVTPAVAGLTGGP